MLKFTGVRSSENVISTNSKGDVICGGEWSCNPSGQVKIINSKDLYFLAYLSFSSFENVIENVKNVWSGGAFCASHVSMTNISENIYCLASYSCGTFAKIENVGGYIFANGYAALGYSDIVRASQVC